MVTQGGHKLGRNKIFILSLLCLAEDMMLAHGVFRLFCIGSVFVQQLGIYIQCLHISCIPCAVNTSFHIQKTKQNSHCF